MVERGFYNKPRLIKTVALLCIDSIFVIMHVVLYQMYKLFLNLNCEQLNHSCRLTLQYRVSKHFYYVIAVALNMTKRNVTFVSNLRESKGEFKGSLYQ